MELVAIASRGTEGVVAEELRALGIDGVTEGRGAVPFRGDLSDGYRAVLWSRTASRVLCVIARAEAASAEALYDGMRAIPWEEHLDVDRTFAVDLVRSGATEDNPRFLMLRTKDAVVDRLRDRRGRRPDVDTRAPDLRVHVHLAAGMATASIDLSGEGLHRRGHGRRGGAAPLKESLAAALLRMAGWPGAAQAGLPLVDPMCGSGTFLLEAAAMARDVAPGLARRRHGLEGWLGHDEALWRALRAEAEERRRAGSGRPVSVWGWDAAEEAVQVAADNARRAGLGDAVRVARRPLEASEPPEGDPGVLITNPPYGARLGEATELGPLYETLGDVLRRRFGGYRAWVLSGDRALDKRIGLRPASRRVVHNGPIECRLLELPISPAPVERPAGPGWRKPSAEAPMLDNRLRKNVRKLGRWARREGIECWRVYDADIPEYNLAIDRYGDVGVLVQEYDRPRSIDPRVAEQHLRDATMVVPGALGVDRSDVHLRVRARRREGEQHERRLEEVDLREVREGGLRFLVSLSGHLDTGLFLDQRQVRARLREAAEGQRFLNLFAYTCAATVHAAAGGARSTTSVDLSNTYLAWGRKNLEANGLSGRQHELVRDDCLGWIEREPRRWDLIFCAPPTWSRSKAMRGDFDVQRDHAALVRSCLRLLRPGGALWFCPVKRDFVLDRAALPGLEIEDLSARTLPPDFARSARTHHTFVVRG